MVKKAPNKGALLGFLRRLKQRFLNILFVFLQCWKSISNSFAHWPQLQLSQVRTLRCWFGCVYKQEGAAVEKPPAMGPSLQLSTCVLFWGFLGLCKAARDPYATCQISSWSDNRRRSYGDFSPTTQLAAVTLTFDPLTLKLVHGVLLSQGPFLSSLVFVGLFVFPLGGGTGQTDRRTDRINTWWGLLVGRTAP